jgi:hypothetical protein
VDTAYDIRIWRCYTPSAHPGETMEKIKPAPAWISGQVRSGQVRTEQILFLRENIAPHSTPELVCRSINLDRNGA